MGRYRNLGQAIEVSLHTYGFDGYYMVAFYNFNMDEEKYYVTMYCIGKNEDGELIAIAPVTRQLSDGTLEYTQPLSGSKGTIRSNICRVIDQMCKMHLVEKFIPVVEDDEDD